MKIFVVGRAFPEKSTGMIGLFEFQQAKALCAAGNDVHYIYFDSRSIKVNRTIKNIEKVVDNVKVHGFLMPLGGIPEPVFSSIKSFFYRKLMDRIFEENGLPDVIHFHFPLLTATLKIWGWLINLREQNRFHIVVTEHWSRVLKKTLNKRQNVFLRKIYKETNAFLAVSNNLKTSIQEICGGDKEIVVVPNMVSDLFCYKKREKTENARFVAIGRLDLLKRFDFLIDAFAEEFAGDKSISLTIIGGGALYNSLKHQIESLKMEKQIFLTGYKELSEVAEILHEMDIYVSASRVETFGVPVIEAWVSGIPAIVADNSPLNDYFTPHNGVLFKLDDKESLRSSLRYASDHMDKYDREEISKVAVGLFSSKGVSKQLMQIYSNI